MGWGGTSNSLVRGKQRPPGSSTGFRHSQQSQRTRTTEDRQADPKESWRPRIPEAPARRLFQGGHGLIREDRPWPETNQPPSLAEPTETVPVPLPGVQVDDQPGQEVPRGSLSPSWNYGCGDQLPPRNGVLPTPPPRALGTQ